MEKYTQLIEEFDFEENPAVIYDGMAMLENFLEFEKLSLEVKIHLSSMLIRRSVAVNTGIYLPVDVDWLINNFLKEYKIDFADRSRTGLHKRAIEMIMSDKMFEDCIIGTTYMFTAIEFFLKHKLGYKVYPTNKIEGENNQRFNTMSIGPAYLKVKKSNFRVSRELHLIDNHFKEQSENMGYGKEFLEFHLLQGRLNSYRNISLHGHNQFFHSEGTLLALLFILLHYCEAHELLEKGSTVC
ncbi:MAG TPA: hypothetical protein VNZ49_17675 [Bacteroidia bacterium]|nr:hypothetical protein [Bacteroidia bacterium]